jgi:hypothetical protein
LFLLTIQAAAEERYVRIDGTFIQPWLYAEWNDEQWERECTALKNIGIETIILGWVAKRESSVKQWETSYPSTIPGTKMKVNSVEPLLKYADKYGFKVYMGLGLDDDWWNWNLSNARDAEKFKNSMQMSARLAKEIHEMYATRYPKVLAGFFCTYEIWNHEDWDRKTLRDLHAERLAEGFNIVIATLDTVAPELPLLFSPFATVEEHASIVSAKAFYDVFLRKTRFRKQDGMLPMDNIGGGGQTLETVEAWAIMYAEAVRNSGNKLNCYANVENFVESREEQIKRSGKQRVILKEDDYIGSAPISRFLQQLEIAEKHASKIFCFSYTHYYSPVNNILGFHEAMLHYQRTGKADTVFPIAPSVVRFRMADTATESNEKIKVLKVNWEGASDDFGIARVNLYKGEELVAYRFAIRCDTEWTISEPQDINYPEFKEDGANYRLGVIDIWGNETKTEPFKINLRTGQVNLRK